MWSKPLATTWERFWPLYLSPVPVRFSCGREGLETLCTGWRLGCDWENWCSEAAHPGLSEIQGCCWTNHLWWRDPAKPGMSWPLAGSYVTYKQQFKYLFHSWLTCKLRYFDGVLKNETFCHNLKTYCWGKLKFNNTPLGGAVSLTGMQLYLSRDMIHNSRCSSAYETVEVLWDAAWWRRCNFFSFIFLKMQFNAINVVLEGGGSKIQFSEAIK